MNHMTKPIILLLALSGVRPDDSASNKTKRTVASGILQTPGEVRPLLLYTDHSGSSTGLTGFYTPVTIKPVFDPEIPKQVAAQQVLYEFQQTPTNAVSNVHVNQFYQPLNHHQKQEPSPNQNQEPSTNQPVQFLTSAETVASPVQHSSLVRHGQNFAQVQFQPLGANTPHHFQTQQYVPGKYLYVNGKIIYQPQPHQIPQQHQIPQHQNIQGQHLHRPLGYYNPQLPNNRLSPPPNAPALPYNRFQPPLQHQIQQITKPLPPPVVEAVEEQNDEDVEEENAAPNEEEGEENDEKSSYEEGDDDSESHFGKYSFEDDDDHESYTEEEDDDSERGSSRYVPKTQQKKTKPRKYNKSNNFKYSENYSSSSKYEKPKNGKKVHPKTAQFKTVKYNKQNGRRPRVEKIEGRQSENIPVVHKQKFLREKWYVTKSSDDTVSR